MLLRVEYRIIYRYRSANPSGVYELRVTPTSSAVQTVRHWGISVSGGLIQARHEDQFRNQVELAALSGAPELEIVSEGLVETRDTAGILGESDGLAPLWIFLKPTGLTSPGDRVGAIARSLSGRNPNDAGAMHALSAAVREAITYEKGHTGVGTTAEQAAAIGRGVCQDHTHAFISAARLLGVPARYVSGYMQLAGEEGAAETHAWAEAHLPGLGWTGFDVSNGVSPDGKYVRVATGRDYSEAAPVKVFLRRPGDAEMVVVLKVEG